MRLAVTISALLIPTVFMPFWNGALLSAELTNEQHMTQKEYVVARKKVRGQLRRIIMNNDGGDAYEVKQNDPRTAKSFLDKRTSWLKGTQVDSIFYCSGVFDNYSHQIEESNVLELSDYTPPGVDWSFAMELGDESDTLSTIASFGHSHGMEVFWSMRMNDTHDRNTPMLFSCWKKEHRECLMGKRGEKFSNGAGHWSAVNYGMQDSRDKVFSIIYEVVKKYNIDGVELDFFRHPAFFKDPVTTRTHAKDEEQAQMTQLMERIRKMTEEVGKERGRPILIAIRTPDSIEYCNAIGINLERWLKSDLLDLLVVTSYFQLNDWEYSVELAHRYGVPVYPSIDESRIRQPAASMRMTDLAYRARASAAWAAGVDGIYIFNQFDPNRNLWNELGDPEALAKLNKDYFGSYRGVRCQGFLPINPFINIETLNPDNPKTIQPGKFETARIQLGRESDGAVIKLRLELDPAIKHELIQVGLNNTNLVLQSRLESWHDYRVPENSIRTGLNQVSVSLSKKAKNALEWKDVLLEIRYPEFEIEQEYWE